MATVHTVLGEIPPSQMGVTLAHEHLFLSYGTARYDLADSYKKDVFVKEISDDLGAAARDHGVKTVVDVTTADFGRDMEIMVEVSRRLNVNIIAATGQYRQLAGLPLYFAMHPVEVMEETMVREIQDGVGPNHVKCGVIKLAMSEAKLMPAEEKAFRAAGRVQKRLGVPIVIHTSGWQATDPALGPRGAVDLLVSEGGEPSRIQVSHSQGAAGNLAPLMELAKKGFYIAFDGTGGAIAGDEMMAAMVGGLVAAGYGNKINLSMDHQSVWFPARPGPSIIMKKSFSNLHKQFIPLLQKGGITERQIHQMMVENPATLFPF
ncbi:MAG: hypothetical protein EXR67_07550 [Dehalococcoidia bacterium]|nr:hypothetical protein [Dehalococcoidia bacterium]